MEYYRADGVRITHNPYDPDMMKKYGNPGETDNEGIFIIIRSITSPNIQHYIHFKVLIHMQTV